MEEAGYVIVDPQTSKYSLGIGLPGWRTVEPAIAITYLWGSDVGTTHSGLSRGQPSGHHAGKRSCLISHEESKEPVRYQLWNGAPGPRALHRAWQSVFSGAFGDRNMDALRE